MRHIPQRDLRNRIGEVLREVESGKSVRVTVRGRALAEARRGGARPKVSDALIAATASVHDLDLYTRDRDFERLPGVHTVLVA